MSAQLTEEEKQLEADKDTKTAAPLIAKTMDKFLSGVKKKQKLKKEEAPSAPTPTPTPQHKPQVSKEKK